MLGCGLAGDRTIVTTLDDVMQLMGTMAFDFQSTPIMTSKCHSGVAIVVVGINNHSDHRSHDTNAFAATAFGNNSTIVVAHSSANVVTISDDSIKRSTSTPMRNRPMADQLLSTVPHHHSLPENYIRPKSQRPRLAEVISDAHIPVVDLSSPDKSHVSAQIGDACRSYGFFQVLNHGVPVELMVKMMVIALEFFRLPREEKVKHYSDDPAKKMRLSTSFNIRKETVHNWRDYLRLHCYPLEDYQFDVFGFVREVVSAYCKEVRQLGFQLLGAISLSLGLEEKYMEEVLGEQEQHMAINYYPKCPQPQLTYGLPAHTDPNALTILLQDPDVSGLQVLKHGQWIAVHPQPHAFVINIGDQLQVTVPPSSFLPLLLLAFEVHTPERSELFS
ncbi:hypothetical protein GW17_00040015 [Ensete ventricosum]|nr:hypothetical protein GW17_00040015 [Ensete ventricosum]